MAENTVTVDQLVNYLKRTGRSGSKTLSVLGHFQPFIDAQNSEIGKELLQDAINLHEYLLQKVADLTATPEETMEYKAVRKIIMAWSERIARYNKAMAELAK
jgi:hypothetical protein